MLPDQLVIRDSSCCVCTYKAGSRHADSAQHDVIEHLLSMSYSRCLVLLMSPTIDVANVVAGGRSFMLCIAYLQSDRREIYQLNAFDR